VRSVNAEQLEVVPELRERNLRRKKIRIREDGEIRRAVRTALLNDPRVRSFKVDVKVDNGIVTLNGLVDNPKAKQVAGEDASNTVGVLGVNNRIKVRPSGMAPDQVIGENVISAIRWDPYLETYEITVVARNRKVYLSGMVDNYYEKMRAGDTASRVAGVEEVRNNLKVSYVWPYKSDDEIKKAVRNRLYWNVFVDSGDVELRVEDGTVTLSGEVADRAAMMAAVRSAFNGGAKKVINRLTVRGQGRKEPEVYTMPFYLRHGGGMYL
ncbi:MAG: BON domain-containing protein, partial [Candidatus Omnitrophica bacterium]|nr:BON domain-containing protein [Candidatus Omnitrophota bacterium]